MFSTALYFAKCGKYYMFHERASRRGIYAKNKWTRPLFRKNVEYSTGEHSKIVYFTFQIKLFSSNAVLFVVEIFGS